LPAIRNVPRQNGGKTAVFLTLVLIMLEFWFLDTITSHTVQIISKHSICPPLAVYPAKMAVKPPFFNFGSDQARAFVFTHNNFSCGANNLTCNVM
jgi:hypothetical protein